MIVVDSTGQLRYNLIMEIEMYSELELLVMKDMMALDFDPLNKEDVQLYWERILG